MKKIKSLFQKDWKNIHSNFTPELKKQWENRGFSYKECKEWIDIGLQPSDSSYAQWLRDTKKVDTDWVLNKGDDEQLREEYHEWFWLRDNGTCPDCKRFNTSLEWCRDCNAKRFRQDFDKWTSGNKEIDSLIQKSQLEATISPGVIEWIPYQEFSKIEFLAQGGFAKVYRAEREKGDIFIWNHEQGKWQRENNNAFVLKVLNNSSQGITKEFLQEISNCQTASKWKVTQTTILCRGISRDPNTGNYVMVMPYAEEGDLRKFLHNHNKWEISNKLAKLSHIALALAGIHYQNLVHKDFHPGNILVRKLVSKNKNDWFDFNISDLGLSRPANETDDKVIYGVVPYVAPEVLRGEKYTTKSDIYSLGMIIYEVLTGYNPFPDEPWGPSLVKEIIAGKRPLITVKLPHELVEIINNCWQDDPQQRPSAQEITTKLNSLFITQEIEHVEFKSEYSHFNNVEYHHPYQIHPNTITHSQLINTEEIARLFQGSEEQALGQEIKKIEKEIDQELTAKQKELVSNFIQVKKLNIKDETNEQAEDKAWDLEDQLEDQGLSQEKIEKIMKYCERFIKAEQQLQANIEIIPTNY